MANWLLLDKIKNWEYPVFTGFQYDYITDQEIAAAMSNVSVIASINTTKDWEDDIVLAKNTTINELQKHAYRVAALVLELQNGGTIKNAIELDSFTIDRCCSCIPNGHHRVRAFQYMGVLAAPFSLSGGLDELEDLVRIAGVKCTKDLKKYVEPNLYAPNEEDVVANVVKKIKPKLKR